MIEQKMINGQPATVIYLKGNFVPATPDDYTMVKISFADGRTVWGRPQHPKSAGNGAAPTMPTNGADPNGGDGGALDKYDPHQARKGKGAQGGRWVKGSGGGGGSEPGKKPETEASSSHPAARPHPAPIAPQGPTRPAEASPREAQAAGAAAASGQMPKPKHKLDRHLLFGDFAEKFPPRLHLNHQDVTTLEELYQKARKDEPVFKQMVEAAAEAVGGQTVYTPPDEAEPGTTLKTMRRAREKMHSDYGGDPSQLKDILRATVTTDTMEDARAAAYTFITQNIGSFVRVKDRIVNPTPEGYRDILVNFRTPSGLIAELQFNTPPMIKVKFGIGHQIFAKTRALRAGPPSPDVERQLEQLDDESDQYYGGAYTQSADGKWRREGGNDQGIGADDAMTKIPITKCFIRLAPPGGNPFLAKVDVEDGRIVVYSTRDTGEWRPDDRLQVEDLMFPIQGSLYDWDYERIPRS